MKLNRDDHLVMRKSSFRCWREIMAAVRERRQHITRTLEERKDWGLIQAQVGMEE